MMDWGNTGWGAGDWIAMSTFMIVFGGGLIALVVWVVRSMRSDRGQSRPDRADALLAERFARGEIDGEEFTRSRELLYTAGSSLSHSGR
ncbi:MAG: SHOCT domain-containing protein [Pseudonocardiales bacterium]|nr:SHOCT domain-containing protein [Pseudonocardiales bacterium]